MRGPPPLPASTQREGGTGPGDLEGMEGVETVPTACLLPHTIYIIVSNNSSLATYQARKQAKQYLLGKLKKKTTPLN